MNQKRYERRAEPTGEAATHDSATLGMTQFDQFKEAERKASETALNSANTTQPPIETRDNRGADDLDGAGKTKPRIPIHEIDRLAEDAAQGFAHDIVRVQAVANGDDLTLTIVTKHGSSTATATAPDWTEAGVKKALKDIEGKIKGDASPSDEPKDKLADAIREIAGSKSA